MKNEITLQRYTIELLIKALENGAVIYTQVNISAI